tara:strand:+ start:1019 stop:2470 length:1452 start_codon:yes stop_codon:yes gene_type:complete
MPDVTINLDQQGFIPLGTESGNVNYFAAFPSFNKLVAALATPDERELGYMTVQSVADWYSRLTSTYNTGWYIDPPGQDDDNNPPEEEDLINATPDGDSSGNWPNGPDPEWRNEWWAVHNYLRYGGTCIVAGESNNLPSTSPNALTTIENTFLDIDCVFTNDYTKNSDIMQIANNRGNCMAVCPVIMTGKIGTCSTPNENNIKGLPDNLDDTVRGTSKLTYHIAGQKYHLGTSQSYVIGDQTSDTLIATPLASDAAGCMARTSASSSPYGSPAGIERGRVLDVVRMVYTPTNADIACLSSSDKKVNYTRTFQGEGTVIFSDKTGRKETQTDPEIFDYVNVTRTYLYLNRAISQVARRYLFERNDASNRAAFVNTANPILRSVFAAGGITEYSIICDSVNNPQTVIDANGFVVDLQIKPSRSVQDITLRFTARAGSETIGSTNASTAASAASPVSSRGNVTPATSSTNTSPSSGSSSSSSSGSGY